MNFSHAVHNECQIAGVWSDDGAMKGASAGRSGRDRRDSILEALYGVFWGIAGIAAVFARKFLRLSVACGGLSPGKVVRQMFMRRAWARRQHFPISSHVKDITRQEPLPTSLIGSMADFTFSGNRTETPLCVWPAPPAGRGGGRNFGSVRGRALSCRSPLAEGARATRTSGGDGTGPVSAGPRPLCLRPGNRHVTA